MLKEGLVGSVTAKNLWRILSRDQPCEVQIQGLELVLGPRLRGERDSGGEKSDNVSKGLPVGGDKNDGDVPLAGVEGGEAAYMDIEVGVRAVAQIVEKIILGLCVKVTNLTIKYEHQQETELTSVSRAHKP